MNSGLFPATIFVRRDFVIDIGQLKPKQISIIASYILIIRFVSFCLMLLGGNSSLFE